MTPYEKAKDLIAKYKNITNNFDQAKQCAAMAVFEIIDYLTDSEQDSAYWQTVYFEIYATPDSNIQSEAKADQFNL
jgi:hypothetical protein